MNEKMEEEHLQPTLFIPMFTEKGTVHQQNPQHTKSHSLKFANPEKS